MLLAALAAGVLLAGSSALRAQDTNNTPPAGEHGPGMKSRGGSSLEQLTKALDLTDDQKPKVKAALAEQMQKMNELRKDPDFASLSREDKMAKMKPIRDELTAKMKAVLTPEQFAKYQEMTKRGPRSHPPGGSPDSPKPQATAPPN
jgi:periplasmic protein CpxP/Spy